MLGGLRRFWGRARRSGELRFIAAFLVIAGILFSLYSFPYPQGSWPQRWSEGYLRAYAYLAGGLLSLFERGLVVSGQTISGRYSLRIIRGCDAADAQILLFASVMASHPYSLRWRAVGATLGFLVITATNVLRICCLYYVGIFAPAYFDFFHHELWPLVLVAMACLAFVTWSKAALRASWSMSRGAS